LGYFKGLSENKFRQELNPGPEEWQILFFYIFSPGCPSGVSHEVGPAKDANMKPPGGAICPLGGLLVYGFC